MESSVVIPITFWNNSQPTFRISSIRITPNGTKLVTSSYDGELSIWNLNVELFELSPRNILMGHSDPVTCLECTDDYAISTSEGGEICRWNLSDGYCSKSVRSVFVHRKIQLFKCSRLNEDLLFTCGDYHEIFILHSVVLHTILVLHSKSNSDWISCFQVMSSMQIGNDVVSGLTKSGYIKLWILGGYNDEISYEVQSNLLPVNNVSHIKCSLNQTQLLVICDKSWTIFDAKFLKTIYSVDRICNEKFLGGDYLDSDVLIWTNECQFYIFKLNGNEARLNTIFSCFNHCPSVFEPAMFFHNSANERYLVQCDVGGLLGFWKVDAEQSNNKLYFSCKLASKFSNIKSKMFDRYTKEVTCCIVVSEFDLFAIGCSDGNIIIVSATRSILSYYFNSSNIPPQYTVLSAHKSRVNCLLYPHERYSHYSETFLLSGGSDFSVCLWDVSSHKLLYRFCVQSGEIVKLLVPPEECKARIRNSICSVASDNSVAILNLKELKCIVLASRQLFPVVTINWRPLDDFIIIECFDGTVYVWEMETGHLDRVLHGITAQEVIYACKESNNEDMSNFYLREDSLVGKDHFRRGLFQIDKDSHCGGRFDLISVRGFLDGFNSENQIVMFNVARILRGIDRKRLSSEMIDPDFYFRVRALTQCPMEGKPREISTRSSEDSEEDKRLTELATFLLSVLHNWQDDLHGSVVPAQCSLISQTFNVSVFLSKTPTPSTFNAVVLIALTTALETAPPELKLNVLKYKKEDFEPHYEALARLWQNRCLTMRKIARKILLSKLHEQLPEDRARLLKRWYHHLPHFPSANGTKLEKLDRELMDMKLIALVLFGVIGSDFRFKMDDPSCEEIYIRETCSAISFLLHEDSYPTTAELRTVATNLLGRGYPVWEPHLKLEKLSHVLFDMMSNYGAHCRSWDMTPELDACLNAHETLKSIAVARTDAFIACLTKEISQIRNSQAPKTGIAFDKSKPEVILILTDLLERTPYIMLHHLDDIISIFVHCISISHLRQDRIDVLTPVLNRFKQVHHSVPTQRIVVGLQDGSVVIHELKTLKTHRITAHRESVSAVMFSPDGKVLATYCHFENRLCFWHVFSSIFGLGHVHLKCIKVCQTNQVDDGSIRNYMQIGELSWIDNKSVLLCLCDGTKTVFHV